MINSWTWEKKIGKNGHISAGEMSRRPQCPNPNSPNSYFCQEKFLNDNDVLLECVKKAGLDETEGKKVIEDESLWSKEVISSTRPCTLHPTPYTPHPTPYTPHPTPHTPHPAICNLHPTP